MADSILGLSGQEVTGSFQLRTWLLHMAEKASPTKACSQTNRSRKVICTSAGEQSEKTLFVSWEQVMELSSSALLRNDFHLYSSKSSL